MSTDGLAEELKLVEEDLTRLRGDGRRPAAAYRRPGRRADRRRGAVGADRGGRGAGSADRPAGSQARGTAAPPRPACQDQWELTVKVIVYGDFNSLYCYLASQRADRLVREGKADVEWCAVEHRPRLPVTGAKPPPGSVGAQDDLAEAAQLALPGEQLPAGPPAVISNTRAAVSAYAEAVADGIQARLRPRLFELICPGTQHEQRVRRAAGGRGPAVADRSDLSAPGQPRPARSGAARPRPDADRAPGRRHDHARRRPADHRGLVTGPGNGGSSGWPCSSQRCPSRPSRP